MRTGQPTQAEWRVVWSDGSVHWIAGSWQVLLNESGEPLRMIGVNLEISERKWAEEALHEMNLVLKERTTLLQSREELLKNLRQTCASSSSDAGP